MRRQVLCVWLVAVVALVACSERAHAADNVVVTVTNSTGSPAGRLVVSFAGTGGTLVVPPFTVFAPTCPTPAVGTAGGVVTIDWGGNCVAAGASISFLATTPNGPLTVVGGSWFGTGGAPLLGPIDTAPLSMYGTDGGTLFTVDPLTATTAPIGTVGAFGVVAAIDCSTECIMYGGTGMNDGDLITINRTTAAEALIGNNGVPGTNDSALEWVGPTLYGIISGGFTAPSSFVTLDPFTGAAGAIGATGLGPIGGIAYDINTGIMYGTEAGATGGGNLVRIDLATGVATIIGPTGYSAVTALEFHPTTGELYGGVGAIDASGGTLVTIDTATGAATPVGPTGYTTVSGLTFCGGKLSVQRIGPGGIILPNGIRIVWRQRIRYNYHNLVYGPWHKPPGQCWTRWCCFSGKTCRRDVNLYIYKTYFGRVLGMRRCIPVVRNQFAGSVGPGWEPQRRTLPPPPDQPQIPIGGPIPKKPPIPGLMFEPFNDGGGGAIDLLTYSDDGGVSYRSGASMSQTFGAMLADISPVMPGAGAPPPPVINFLPTMQQLGPGYCISANRLTPLINELQIVEAQEPNPWITQLKAQIQLLQVSLASVCNQMNSGAPMFDPNPYFNAASANTNIANLLQSVPLPGDATPDSALRLANASEHFHRCALGWQTAGQQVAANMFDGINDTVERDTFYWHFVQHYPTELAMAAAALDRHVRLRVTMDGPIGWGHEANEPIEIELVSLSLTSVQPFGEPYIMPVSHGGDVYIRRPDSADNFDEDMLFRVKVKFPTTLSRVVDVAPGDGRIIEVAPMIRGDVDGDNCITPNDLQLVNENMGTGGEFAPVVHNSDVNFDGNIDPLDAAIVQQNMGLCGQLANDCNGNGMDDTIDLLNGVLHDCNENDIADECEVAAGIAEDDNDNGVPDECDCPADLDGPGGQPDGQVNVNDLFRLLANWNTSGPGADLAPPLNIVNVADLFALLAAWGDCD